MINKNIEKSKNHFLGINNHQRLNCASAIFKTFEDKFKMDKNILEIAKNFGGGKAPNGFCGAYYATLFILEKYEPKKILKFEKFFKDNLKYNVCKDLKINNISCLSCIEKSAEFLEKI